MKKNRFSVVHYLLLVWQRLFVRITAFSWKKLMGIILFLGLLAGPFLIFYFNRLPINLDVNEVDYNQQFLLRCTKDKSSFKINANVCSWNNQRQNIKNLLQASMTSDNLTDLRVSKQIFVNKENKKTLNSVDKNSDFLINAELRGKFGFFNSEAFNKYYYDLLTSTGGYTLLDSNGNDLLLTKNNPVLNSFQNQFAWARYLIAKNIRIPQNYLLQKTTFKSTKNNLLPIATNFEFKVLFHQLNAQKRTKLNATTLEQLKKHLQSGAITESDIFIRYLQELLANKKDDLILFTDFQRFWERVKNIEQTRKAQGKNYNAPLLTRLKQFNFHRNLLEVNNRKFLTNPLLKEAVVRNALISILANFAQYKKNDLFIDNYLLFSRETATGSLNDNVITKKVSFFTYSGTIKNRLQMLQHFNFVSAFYNALTKSTAFRLQGFFYQRSYQSVVFAENISEKKRTERYQKIWIYTLIGLIVLLAFLVYFFQFFGLIIGLFAAMFGGVSYWGANLLLIPMSFSNILLAAFLLFAGILWQLWIFGSLKTQIYQKTSLLRLFWQRWRNYGQILNYYVAGIIFALGVYFISGIGTRTTPRSNLDLSYHLFGLGQTLLLLLVTSFVLHFLLFAAFNFAFCCIFDQQWKIWLKYFGHSPWAIQKQRFIVQTPIWFARKLSIFNHFSEFGFILVFAGLGFFILFLSDSFTFAQTQLFNVWTNKKWIVNAQQDNLNVLPTGFNYKNDLLIFSKQLTAIGYGDAFVPIETFNGQNWIYGLQINGPINQELQGILKSKGFVPLFNGLSQDPFMLFESAFFLKLAFWLWLLSGGFFLFRFGISYFLIFLLSFIKIPIFLGLLIVANVGINELVLNLIFAILFLDVLFNCHVYLKYFYHSQKDIAGAKRSFLNAFSSSTYYTFMISFFFMAGLLVLGIFLFWTDYNWFLLLVLLSVLPMWNYWWANKATAWIITLQAKKTLFYGKIRKKIMDSVKKEQKQQEGTVLGVND